MHFSRGDLRNGLNAVLGLPKNKYYCRDLENAHTEFFQLQLRPKNKCNRRDRCYSARIREFQITPKNKCYCALQLNPFDNLFQSHPS